MNRLRALSRLLVLLAVTWCTSASAQPIFGELRAQIVDGGSMLAVTLRLRAGSAAFDLGSSNFAFTYNAEALSYPASPTAGTDYSFLQYDGAQGNATYASTVTHADGELSVNIALLTIPDSLPLPTTDTDVVEIYLTITDPDQMAGLAWSFVEVQDDAPSLVASSELDPTLLGGAFADPDSTPLPVELTGFDVRRDGSAVLLQWTTTSETNNSGFDVQLRRADAGPAWTSAGFVEGHGTTQDAHTYRFRLHGLDAGTYRFRLRQVDLEGTATYGPEVEAAVELTEPYRLAPAHPNPFRHRAAFTLGVREAQRVQIRVYDALGREVARLYDGPLPAHTTHTFWIDGSEWPSGLYLYEAAGEHFRTTGTVVLVK